MWYKIFDFNIFEEKSYPYQLIKGDWGLPLIDIDWKVCVGDFVKKGDCLFTCKVDNSHYQQKAFPFNNQNIVIYDGICTFNSPSDGFVYYKPNRKYKFMCKKSLEICAVCETKEEVEGLKKYDNINRYLGDYSKYKLVKTEQWNYVHGGYYKFFVHPSLRLNDKNVNRIVTWILSNKDLTFGSYGGNEGIDWNCFFYINEDYSIDIFADSFSCLVRYETSLPDFVKFREVTGNFSIYFHQTTDDSKITLVGCPDTVHGNFECSRCRLTKFENVPSYVEGDFIAKSNKLSSFIGMPKYIGGCFNFSNNDFTDEAWEYCRDNIEGEFCDYNNKGNKFIKYRKELH